MGRPATALLLTIAALIVPAHSLGVFLSQLGYDEPWGTLRGAYSYVLCHADEIIEPSNTQDVASAIKSLSSRASAAGIRLKVRVTQRLFHTSTAFACPAQPAALVGGRGDVEGGTLPALFVQSKMQKVLSVDSGSRTLRVSPGITLWELAEAATSAGLSLPVGSVPLFGGLTLGGAIAAGAHGMGGAGGGDAPVDFVTEITWVDGSGEVRVTKRGDYEFGAFYAGLGLVGVMTELTVQLPYKSHTRVESVLNKPDSNMVDEVMAAVQSNPHLMLVWRPDVGQYALHTLTEVPTSVPADESLVNTIIADLSNEFPVGLWTRASQADVRDDLGAPIMNDALGEWVTRLTVARGWAGHPGGGTDTVQSGVGLTNRLQTTYPCTPNCQYSGWQYRTTAYDIEFTLDSKYLRSFVDDVRAVIQRDLFRDGATKARYLGPGYIWMRFGSPRGDLLATQQGMERPVFVQSTWLRSRDAFEYPMRFGYVQDLIELLLLSRYDKTARPHWGKNVDRTFTHPDYPVRWRYPRMGELQGLQAKYDPNKIFEPPLFTKVASGSGYTHYSGCALEFACFCYADDHCNHPGKPQDFKCVPSSAFPEYRVCKGPADLDPDLIKRYGSGAWVTRSDQTAGMDLTRALVFEPLMANPVTAQLLRAAAQKG
ncbi:L-gulonolactone oxidase-like [Raphidocelis subcapitata]|uniref:L-gulonolactone oxidase-like n=1 Tax=Raphidocelis subcapitata TaxID=307507 RepID=A0A2V0PGK2_9CHLO|nr:L-gulonolactone oxidase-like [Raphidocelis subcapitata]|eukprot:GBF98974.1 L-gulonolactone oxidase-like [Raphidocelis subcapitata]